MFHLGFFFLRALSVSSQLSAPPGSVTLFQFCLFFFAQVSLFGFCLFSSHLRKPSVEFLFIIWNKWFCIPNTQSCLHLGLCPHCHRDRLWSVNFFLSEKWNSARCLSSWKREPQLKHCHYVEFNIPFSSGTNSAFQMSRTKSVGGGI